jgi:branched-chain amino acid aminotransferase
VINDCCGNYCLINDRLAKSDELCKISLNPKGTFYEVIRVVDGVFLYLEDHLLRLVESVNKIKNYYSIDYDSIYNKILKFKINIYLRSGNVKIVINFTNNTAKTPTVLIYQIPHFYPTEKQYNEGVNASLFLLERKNPNIKYINITLQKRFREEIASRQVFEVLLVDHNNFVTEGSKSNLFFMGEQFIYTPPSDRVLRGITREKVIQICNILNYNLIEDNISINNLNIFESAFLTGTSPKVLPISSIDNFSYNYKNTRMKAIIEMYDSFINNYISNRKQNTY